jgi:predicted pyridoxine 5'-phosphate oxidase superfamily flavin-nucleotide-binding protein
MVIANDSQVTWRSAMARLTSTADLRRVISEPRAATRAKILDALDEQSIDFLKRCPFALVGTTAADGTIEVSPKGDEPGFIRVEDPKTLLIPERIGNNLAFGLSNILATGKIGLIGLVPATGETLRVSGTAEIFDDPDLVAGLGSLGKPALLATRVHIQHCYFSSVFGSSTLMKPGSSPLGETSMVPSAAVVPTRAKGQRFRKSIDCSSSASRILARVAARGSEMTRRRSAVEVRRAIALLRVTCESFATTIDDPWV